MNPHFFNKQIHNSDESLYYSTVSWLQKSMVRHQTDQN